MDTSDLPTEPDAISQAPPPYEQAVSPPEDIDVSTTSQDVTIYLEEDEAAA